MKSGNDFEKPVITYIDVGKILVVIMTLTLSDSSNDLKSRKFFLLPL